MGNKSSRFGVNGHEGDVVDEFRNHSRTWSQYLEKNCMIQSQTADAPWCLTSDAARASSTSSAKSVASSGRISFADAVNVVDNLERDEPSRTSPLGQAKGSPISNAVAPLNGCVSTSLDPSDAKCGTQVGEKDSEIRQRSQPDKSVVATSPSELLRQKEQSLEDGKKRPPPVRPKPLLRNQRGTSCSTSIAELQEDRTPSPVQILPQGNDGISSTLANAQYTEISRPSSVSATSVAKLAAMQDNTVTNPRSSTSSGSQRASKTSPPLVLRKPQAPVQTMVQSEQAKASATSASLDQPAVVSSECHSSPLDNSRRRGAWNDNSLSGNPGPTPADVSMRAASPSASIPNSPLSRIASPVPSLDSRPGSVVAALGPRNSDINLRKSEFSLNNDDKGEDMVPLTPPCSHDQSQRNPLVGGVSTVGIRQSVNMVTNSPPPLPTTPRPSQRDTDEQLRGASPLQGERSPHKGNLVTLNQVVPNLQEIKIMQSSPRSPSSIGPRQISGEMSVIRRGSVIDGTAAPVISLGSGPDGLVGDTDLYIALFDYIARATTELTFKKGDKFKILRKKNEMWWEAESIDAQARGWVPSDYIGPVRSLDQYPWFHGQATRVAAEVKLESGVNGAFLVRESESNPGEYSISLKYEGKVYHYRIRKHSTGAMGINDEFQFGSLAELIQHYSANADGLVCTLRHAVNARLDAPAVLVPVDDPDGRWEIDRNDIKLGNKLGHGQYGDVYEGFYRKSMHVAIKTLKGDSIDTQEFVQEVSLMQKLKHPNLLRLLGVCTLGSPLYMVTEFMSKGDLLSYLRRDEGERLDAPALLYIAQQVAAGMTYLQSLDLVHRDLAARNCLVGDNSCIKIADFGMAQKLVNGEFKAQRNAKMPIKWSAPESLANNIFTRQTDVWSYGVLVWEICTFGKPPFLGIENQEILEHLRSGQRLERPDGCPDELYEVMTDCWHWEGDQRADFESIKRRLEGMFPDSNVNDAVNRTLRRDGTLRRSRAVRDVNATKSTVNRRKSDSPLAANKSPPMRGNSVNFPIASSSAHPIT